MAAGIVAPVPCILVPGVHPLYLSVFFVNNLVPTGSNCPVAGVLPTLPLTAICVFPAPSVSPQTKPINVSVPALS